MSCLMSCRFLVLILASPVSSLPRRFLVASSSHVLSLPRLLSNVACLVLRASCPWCFVHALGHTACTAALAILSPTDPVPRGLLTLCPKAF